VNPIWYQAHKIVNRIAFQAVRDRKDILAMQALAPLSPTYLPWSGAAMRPTAVATVINEVVVNGRRLVVELGGGISTFYLARALRDAGGHLYTVEHNDGWASILERKLRDEGLGDSVTVIYAPLKPTSTGWGGDDSWYAEEDLRAAVPRAGVDLLLVDGPPAYGEGRRHTRYPAVPFFSEVLAPAYTIVLDDIDRRGEQEILPRWESLLGIRFERRFVRGSIALGRRGPSLSF